ncbi:T9SS type A sorting domain-containing protein [Flammeovirga kamogawensis]|uniref:T9SS type A sorting domain-containing protein n=1 Tax=Flammeovirga kamogawensis TaxID=373891 RepID=A0ABX8H0D5_9BACT|nr:T9SS type A sorting domain-containing protein [Flammeovirga kamogawensis]MBB6459511.1 hypothetical protein [Flammeovirga kamogawensis]QWG09062.1 T9SS type A sorting domain-containing protein [Flammeovirga kamogawensis]TRX67351.1 T9SS type A sorting domain-containing protein [Flammeovirga kamogawensis]
MHKFFTLLLFIFTNNIYAQFCSPTTQDDVEKTITITSDCSLNGLVEYSVLSGYDLIINNNITLEIKTTGNVDNYVQINGNITLNEGASLTIESEAFFIINGNLSLSGNNNITIGGGGNFKSAYLIVTGDFASNGVGSSLVVANKGTIYAGSTSGLGTPSVSTGSHDGIYIEGDDDLGIEDHRDFILANSVADRVSDLPVELISFEATVNPNNTTLTWSTASEQNASHFDVMRSNDKRNWEVLATLDAAGNSNVKRDYKFVDNDLLTAVTYYKLVQVDFDEAYEEFGPLTVYPNGVEKSLTANIFPNPSADGSKIQLDGLSLGNSIQLSVIDKSGRMIFQDTIQDSPESLLYNLETRTTLYPGNYLIVIQSGNEKIVKRYIQQ